MPKLRVANRLTRLISRFVISREANVAVMTAVVMVPTIYLLGMAMDFTQALRHRAQLDAATDAAAIAAVRPAMLMQSDAVAQATAAAVFATTANSIKGALTPSTAPTPTITIVDSGLQRIQRSQDRLGGRTVDQTSYGLPIFGLQRAQVCIC